MPGNRKDEDLRSTINDKDWRSIQDRADKANPDRWRLTDPEGAAARKRANDNYKNRDKS